MSEASIDDYLALLIDILHGVYPSQCVSKHVDT